MPDTVRFDRVTKHYRLGSERGNVWGIRPGRNPEKGRVVTVLHDISFALAEGDCLGIVGPNGSGKSTLLRLVAHVTTPTRGRVRTAGRIAPMLELGVAFHPDLTGRENVFFAGAIIGVPRSELVRRYDEIVEFAGIGRFMDTPVKRYSTGMAARLGFAVSMAVDADILIVDEVLGVGDIDFRARSVQRIGERAAEGATILVVTHNIDLVPSLCNVAMHLEAGRVVDFGNTTQVIARYRGAEPGPVGAPEPPPVEVSGLLVDPPEIESSEGFRALCQVEISGPVPDGRLFIRAVATDGTVVGIYRCPEAERYFAEDCLVEVELLVRWFPMVEGRYRLDVVIEASDGSTAAIQSGYIQVWGDEGSRASQALIASIREFSIEAQIEWAIRELD